MVEFYIIVKLQSIQSRVEWRGEKRWHVECVSGINQKNCTYYIANAMKLTSSFQSVGSL